MKERKVHVHFIDLGGDVTGNGIGAIIFTILSAFATFEKERIATRIREVKQIKKSQGKFTGGKAGFGYEVIDGVKVANKDQQKVISEMKRLRGRGKSYRYIATWLEKNKGVEMTFMGVRSIILAHKRL
jgi:DNA invertase Pin-like site-specific DNA recombinase